MFERAMCAFLVADLGIPVGLLPRRGCHRDCHRTGEYPLASIASPREEELLGIDRHIGEVVDPSTWPAAAIGVVAVAYFNKGGRCTGTLVAPRIVLTAAHCLLNGTELISPGNVHFLAGMNKGRTESSPAAERFIVAKDFVPTLRDKWTLDRSPAAGEPRISKESGLAGYGPHMKSEPRISSFPGNPRWLDCY
jgi:hypothetical protein